MLTQLLQAEAHKRGFAAEVGPALSLQNAFVLVRDMPYQRASDRLPETTILEWRGTCSGKHYLLKNLLEEMGFPTKLMACTHYINPKISASVGEGAARLLAEGPVPDVHNYLIVKTPEGDMIIDATWPTGSEQLGLPVNRQIVLGEDMQLACKPIDHFQVPDEEDPQSFKDTLLQKHFSAEEVERRRLFFISVAG